MNTAEGSHKQNYFLSDPTAKQSKEGNEELPPPSPFLLCFYINLEVLEGAKNKNTFNVLKEMIYTPLSITYTRTL